MSQESFDRKRENENKVVSNESYYHKVDHIKMQEKYI